jgi:hypothetical protein
MCGRKSCCFPGLTAKGVSNKMTELSRLMRLKRWGLCLLAAANIFYLGAGCSGGTEAVARVNEAEICRHELDRFINLMRLFNPELDHLWQEDALSHRQVELEFLQILIDIELVRQATARLSLSPDLNLVEQKAASMLRDLAAAQYGGSMDMLHRRREQLNLQLEDLSIIPRYELNLVELFEYVADAITEEDLLLFVEENPELMHREAALEVFWVTSESESAAREYFTQLEQGVPMDDLVAQLQTDSPAVETGTLGWITERDPFVEPAVKEKLFSLVGGERGVIIKAADRFTLYWIGDTSPARALNFAEVKAEASVRKQYILYQDYFNMLWSEGQIEILL